MTPSQPACDKQRCLRVRAGEHTVFGASGFFLGRLDVHEKGVGERELALLAHPGACERAAGQTQGLIRSIGGKPERGRDDGRGPGLGIETIGVTLVSKSIIGGEQVGN